MTTKEKPSSPLGNTGTQDWESSVTETPWDRKSFGLATFEIKKPTTKILREMLNRPGHYTVKVDPIESKKNLHEFGFYYCDSLLEPYTDTNRFKIYPHSEVTISQNCDIDDLLEICHGAFRHGRFHRDFLISQERADLRYDNWLREIHAHGNTLGLLYAGELAGFFAYSGNRILLHAVSPTYRGCGLAKFMWSRACEELFKAGHQELSSSVSATNLSVMNLYISLGFRFRNPIDIYHRLVK